MEDLIRGREFTNQLRFLFEKRKPISGDEDFHVSAKDLADKIFQTLNTAISQLNSSEPDGGVCQSPVNSDDRKTVDSGVFKRTLVTSDRKVGYKRRKNSHTWVKISPVPINDGHAWRKYGQKGILHSKFPRSYFRCTHKNDQNCLATKQVQKTEDDPPMYHTTYMGQHTCKLQDKLKAPQLILDSEPSHDYSLINFVTKLATSSPIVKQEFSREEIANESNEQDVIMSQKDLSPSSSSSPLSELLWTDLPPFVLPGNMPMLGSASGISEHGDGVSDIYSCATSDQGFDMDLMVGSVINFDEDAFYFDETFMK